MGRFVRLKTAGLSFTKSNQQAVMLSWHHVLVLLLWAEDVALPTIQIAPNAS